MQVSHRLHGLIILPSPCEIGDSQDLWGSLVGGRTVISVVLSTINNMDAAEPKHSEQKTALSPAESVMEPLFPL